MAGSSPAAGSRIILTLMKIPKHAKRVFNGTVFDIYQWKQKMFDGSKKTFEIAHRLDTISIIAIVENKIVILYQQQPNTPWYYTLPGGYVDDRRESHKKAALRELLEETGLKPKKIKLWKNYRNDTRLKSNHYIYIAQDCKKVAEQTPDGGEKIKVKLISFEKFLKFAHVDNFHNRGLVTDMLKAIISAKAKRQMKSDFFS